MTLDWNWFFAAFAQCGAALIAIIGAFIISKLLGESEKEEQNASKIDELIIHYNDLVKRVSCRYFHWYDNKHIEYSTAVSESIRNGDFDNLNDSEKLKRLLELEPSLFETDGCIETLNKRIEKLRPTSSSFGGGYSAVSIIPDLTITPKDMWLSLTEEKEIIDSLRIESETLIEQFVKAKSVLDAASRNLTPIKVTIYILILGLIITVIYPLHFLPLKLNEVPNIEFTIHIFQQHLFSVKGVLLILLTFVIEGIFGYFLNLTINTERMYNRTKSKLSDKYFDIASYSKYFK